MKKGVLLVNLGSPDSPSVPDVRRYLNEFLMDGRVIDAPWPVRRFVVGMILINRPRESAHAYEKVWTKEGSPLVVTSRHVQELLQKRVSLDDALKAVDECGAPIVSIPGGEPLIHKEMPQIVAGIVARRKFVYLCTNALLLSRRMNEYAPSPYLTFSVHLDGNRDRHDTSVCRTGVFDEAVKAIQMALQRRFRVTINCTLFQGESAQEVAAFLDDAMALGVEGVTISPGFSYQHAPQQDVFIQRNASKQLFRNIFMLGKKRRWRLNHSSLFLNFLAGNETYRCTPWGNPTRNVFGWQKPCYLLVDEGYAPTFKALMEETKWDRYGTGNNPKCANCMAHCGYEATAVNDALGHPLKGLRVSLRGPKTAGPFAPELPTTY